MSSYADRIIDSIVRSCYNTEEERLGALNEIIAELVQYKDDLLEEMEERKEWRKEEEKEQNKLN